MASIVVDGLEAKSRPHAYLDRALSADELLEVEAHTPVPGRELLRRFTYVSLAITLIATALATYAMGRLVEAYLLGQVELKAQELVDQATLLLPAGETLVEAAGAVPSGSLAPSVQQRLLEPPTEGFALWDQGGQLQYAVGWAAGSAAPDLLTAVLANHSHHKVTAGPDGRRLLVLMPVFKNGTVVGVFEVEQDYEPLAKHIGEMQEFAAASLSLFSIVLYLLLFQLVRRAARDLAAEAAANSRLSDEARRAAGVAIALLRTAEALSRLAPLDQLLEDVAGRAVELLGADDALMFLAEDEGRRFVLRGRAGVPPEKLAAFPLQTVDPAGFLAFAELRAGTGPLVIEDAQCSALLPAGLAQWWGAVSCVFVPLEVGNRLEGAMVVHFTRAPHRVAAEALRLVSGLAGQAAVAIANCRAFETIGEVEALREVARLKGEFVSLVSHELRTPLSSVVGFSELLAVRDFEPDEVKAFAAQINREALHLNTLVEDLLELGRLESGRFALTLEPIDLASFAEEVAARFGPTAPNHTIKVEVESAVTVRADRGRLRQVLDNLVSNAIRYSPDGGPIDLHVGQTAAGLGSVSVRDRGLGIDPEEAGRLFERFYRSGRRQVRAIKGTGLGLSIARAIITAHNGSIRAESPGPGHGSTFTAELPIASDDEWPEPIASPGAQPPVVAAA